MTYASRSHLTESFSYPYPAFSKMISRSCFLVQARNLSRMSLLIYDPMGKANTYTRFKAGKAGRSSLHSSSTPL